MGEIILTHCLYVILLLTPLLFCNSACCSLPECGPFYCLVISAERPWGPRPHLLLLSKRSVRLAQVGGSAWLLTEWMELRPREENTHCQKQVEFQEFPASQDYIERPWLRNKTNNIKQTTPLSPQNEQNQESCPHWQHCIFGSRPQSLLRTMRVECFS